MGPQARCLGPGDASSAPLRAASAWFSLFAMVASLQGGLAAAAEGRASAGRAASEVPLRALQGASRSHGRDPASVIAPVSWLLGSLSLFVWLSVAPAPIFGAVDFVSSSNCILFC